MSNMPSSPEYDKFVKTISSFSQDIKAHSILSWKDIDFNLDEPEIIESFLLKKGVGVDYLNNNLAPILSSTIYEVKFASVFIHKKPKITREENSIKQCTGSTPSCELGDLLVVFCLLDKNKKPLFRSAVISQAKKGAAMTSQSQQCLYDSDTSFLMPAVIQSKSKASTRQRRLPDYSQGRTKALNYLILDNPPFLRQIPWDCKFRFSWPDFMNRILTGDLGLPFGNITSYNQGWNCIIEDLLNIGIKKIPSSIKRASVSLSDLVDIFNDFREYDKYSVTIDDEGMPILFIIARNTEYSL